MSSATGAGHLAALVAATLAGACTMSDIGLGPAPDAGPTGGSTATCPMGLTDKADWPAGTTFTSCTKPCGPDSIGTRSCSQGEKEPCQAASGCVCLDAPCVTCGTCAFWPALPDCYVPTNAASAQACAKGVTQGGVCAPACGRQLCLEADGKTGCVCNAQGKYACATWGDTTWK